MATHKETTQDSGRNCWTTVSLDKQGRFSAGEAGNHLHRKSCIPPHILEEAVELVLRRIRFVTAENALHFDVSQPLMRLAWNLLHQGELSVNNVAIILESWAHREISAFGEDARPGRGALQEWAAEIDAMLSKVNKALSNP